MAHDRAIHWSTFLDMGLRINFSGNGKIETRTNIFLPERESKNDSKQFFPGNDTVRTILAR